MIEKYKMESEIKDGDDMRDIETLDKIIEHNN